MLDKQYETESLCPVCLKKIPASLLKEGDSYYMQKTCPEHGSTKTVLWRGGIPMEDWRVNKERANLKKTTKVEKGCPYDCGLCAEHRQHTCTALIEVTQNCNLNCKFCFADSLKAKSKEPALSDILLQFQKVMEVSGNCNIQLSGGEPTVRDDLPEIIKMGKELGFSFIQVNTNGIRMADHREYVKALKKAGLSSIFLQFDGTRDEIYKKLRGRPLFETKLKAIENCKKYGIGVVLVPTIVPGVNVENIGEIIRFGMEHSPTVRGIHMQPVSYFGRIPHPPEDKDRITLPEIMKEITKQTGERILEESMKPPGCEHARCSFHGNYLIDGTKLLPVTKRSACCCSTKQPEEGSNKAKAFVARNWSGNEQDLTNHQQSSDWDRVLETIQRNSFSISAMAFQDVWNVDIERIKECCIHVVTPDLKLIPFCMYNLTSINGTSLYRK